MTAHDPGHDTELAAAAAVKPALPFLQGLVLQLLRDNPDGLTDDEGAQLLGRDRLDFGRRRCELVKARLVVKTGLRRKTPRGRYAIVWRLASPR